MKGLSKRTRRNEAIPTEPVGLATVAPLSEEPTVHLTPPTVIEELVREVFLPPEGYSLPATLSAGQRIRLTDGSVVRLVATKERDREENPIFNLEFADRIIVGVDRHWSMPGCVANGEWTRDDLQKAGAFLLSRTRMSRERGAE